MLKNIYASNFSFLFNKILRVFDDSVLLLYGIIKYKTRLTFSKEQTYEIIINRKAKTILKGHNHTTKFSSFYTFSELLYFSV